MEVWVLGWVGIKVCKKKKSVQKDIGGPGSDIPRLYVTLASE